MLALFTDLSLHSGLQQTTQRTAVLKFLLCHLSSSLRQQLWAHLMLITSLGGGIFPGAQFHLVMVNLVMVITKTHIIEGNEMLRSRKYVFLRA